MVRWTQGWKLLLIGAAFTAASPFVCATAQAAAGGHGHSGGSKHATGLPTVFHGPAATYRVAFHSIGFAEHSSSKHGLSKNGKSHYSRYVGSYGGGSLQCVPFARAASGIELKGNAADWWYAAAGVYDRGERPEPGSVLNFRSTGHMRLGHVAVVTAVLGTRQIEIDHANWAGPGASKGGISRGIPVIDVSASNDWSEVRVGLGQSGEYGSNYPTYGFIYDRPDTGTMMANNAARPFSTATYNTAYLGNTGTDEEVAEAPLGRRGTIRVHRPTLGHRKPHH